MKITLRTERGEMYAKFEGYLAERLLSEIVPVTEYTEYKGKKAFRFVEDLKFLFTQMSVYLFKGSIAIVEK